MIKKTRVPKSKDQMMRDCETHLYFLWDALRLYPQQPERFKQIAAELRVLVCETRQNRPLLLRLMDEYSFSYDIQPPVEPFDKQPIPMVGWRDDPVHKALSEDIQTALGDQERIGELLERQAALRRAVPFREYVNRALAVYIAPYDYSYRELTLAVAQQLGSSHEDDSVEEPITRLQDILIGGHQGHVAPLIVFAELVIEIGSRFLGFLVENHGYIPKYFKTDAA